MTPYVIAHLRLVLALEHTGFVFQEDDHLRIFLTNTFEMGAQSVVLYQEAMVDQIKGDLPILLVMDNSHYDSDHPHANGYHHSG